MPDDTTTKALLLQAHRAPSSHNTQPWIFSVDDDALSLIADRTRALPVNDPEDRELTISCGCALFNLRVAAAEAGLAARYEALPEGADEDVLARIIFTDGADTALAELAPAIEARRTYRKRFEDRPVPQDLVAGLVDAADREGAFLVRIDETKMRQRVAELVSEGDAIQWHDPRWRRELAAWMHPRRRGDGLNLPWLAVPVAQLVVRSFDMGGGVGAKDRELTKESPILAVLGTEGDGPTNWLRAGQALERLLLAAANAGLQASFLNQPVQVAALRPRLRDVTGLGGMPQILLRLGYPHEDLPAAPRRPLAGILDS